MFNDKNNVINQIQDGLGSEGSRELAEQMFAAMRVDGRIIYDDLRGLQIRDGVDLIEVAVEVERANAE